MNLAIAGLNKLHADNGFSEIQVEEVRKKYEQRSNTVKGFVESKCIIDVSDPMCDILATDLYAGYCNYCKDNNERPLDMSVLGKRLKEAGIEKKQMQRSGERSQYYIGIKLNYDIRSKDSKNDLGGLGI